MASHVPAEIVLATKTGDVATVERWLANGGDPNRPVEVFNADIWWEPILDRLLSVAANNKHPAIVRALLAHGADVNYAVGNGNPCCAFWLAHQVYDVVSARLPVKNGADVAPGIEEALISPRNNHRKLHFMLISGVDVSALSCEGETPENHARSRLQYFTGYQPCADDSDSVEYGSDMRNTYAESVAILEGTRLAGSYKQCVLREFKQLLRIRSLLARGRARTGPRTPEVVTRLFGARAEATGRALPPTRRRQPPPGRTRGLPDPAFWLVMEYWRLGAGRDWDPERVLRDMGCEVSSTAPRPPAGSPRRATRARGFGRRTHAGRP